MSARSILAKRIVAAVIVISTVLTPASVSAKYTYEDAADEFRETLELIDSVYLDKDSLDYKKLVDEAILSVFDQLDPYSEYMSKQEYEGFMSYGDTNKAGIGVGIVRNGAGFAEITKVYKGSPAEKAGILEGDMIIMVGEFGVRNRTMPEVRGLIIGETGTAVSLVISRNGENMTISAQRGTFIAPLAERMDISGLIPGASDKKAAYVVISAFSSNEAKPQNDTAVQFAKIYDELKKEKIENLIIDLRDNSGGDVSACIDIAQQLVKIGKLFTFRYNDGSSDTFRSRKAGVDFKVCVLVNENTASASEILASAIKESGSGIVVGTDTFGKGVGQMPIPAADGKHMIKITVAEILSRNGNKINGVGVKPDIYIEPAPYILTDKEINGGSSVEEIDALKKALEYLGYAAGADVRTYDGLKGAVAEFQRYIGAEPDGVCDKLLVDRLNDFISDKFRKKDYALEKAYEELNK